MYVYYKIILTIDYFHSMPHTRKKQKKLTKVNGGNGIPSKSLRRPIDVSVRDLSELPIRVGRPQKRDFIKAIQTIINSIRNYSVKPTNQRKFQNALQTLVLAGLLSSAYCATVMARVNKKPVVQELELGYIRVPDRDNIQLVLNKMVEIWNTFKAVQPEADNNFKCGSWYDIYKMIPRGFRDKIYPNWGDATGSAEDFIKWLLRLPKLADIIECDIIWLEKGVSVEDMEDTYTKFASIVNSGGIHFFTYLYQYGSNKYVHFDATGHDVDATGHDVDATGHDEKPAPRIQVKDKNNKNTVDISLPDKLLTNLWIRNDAIPLIRHEPESPPDTLNNYRNACAINSVWYALMGFPELRGYCYGYVPQG